MAGMKYERDRFGGPFYFGPWEGHAIALQNFTVLIIQIR